MPLQIFTAAERTRLNSFPEAITTEDLSRYYHLSERDKREVLRQRDEHGRLGFALQLCSLRHLDFIPKNLLQPPLEVLHFVADQLKVSPASLNKYQRPATQSQHLQHILGYTGFRRASPLDDLALADWLVERALEHDKPLLLFELACTYLQQRNVIRLGITALERHISAARSHAHRITYDALEPLLTREVRAFLAEVLQLVEGKSYTHLTWLQQAPTEASPSQIKTVMAKIRYLQAAGVTAWDVSNVNPNRFMWLAQVGAGIAKQNLLNLSVERRTAILIAFLHQSLYSYTDDVIYMMGERIWELYGQAKQAFEEDRRKARNAINEKLHLLQLLGDVLLDEAIAANEVRDEAFKRVQRSTLSSSLEENKALLRPEKDAYVDYFRRYYQSVRNVAKPLLATLSFESWGEDHGLMEALELIREIHLDRRHRIPNSASTGFIPDDWLNYVWSEGEIERYYYELAAIWVLRARLRSGDVYVKHSRRYAPLESYLIPRQEWPRYRLVVCDLIGAPQSAEVRLAEREAELQGLCEQVERALLDPSRKQLRVEQDKLIYRPDEAEDVPPRVNQPSDDRRVLAANRHYRYPA